MILCSAVAVTVFPFLLFPPLAHSICVCVFVLNKTEWTCFTFSLSQAKSSQALIQSTLPNTNWINICINKCKLNKCNKHNSISLFVLHSFAFGFGLNVLFLCVHICHSWEKLQLQNDSMRWIKTTTATATTTRTKKRNRTNN